MAQGGDGDGDGHGGHRGGDGGHCGRTTFQPSFYAASVVYCVVAAAVVLGLSAVLVFRPSSRPHVPVFLAVFASGAALTVVLAMRRIYAVERDYSKNSGRDALAHRQLGCPDTFVADGSRCEPGTVTLTTDRALTSRGRLNAAMTHTAPQQAIDLTVARHRCPSAFLKNECEHAGWLAIPWAAHKALCPLPAV